MTYRAVSVEHLVWVEAESDTEAIEKARDEFKLNLDKMELAVVDVDDTEGAEY
jgi:hypothetical protein